MSRDLRKYTRDTNVRMAVGAIVLLFVVGVGLVWIIYGEGAGGMAFTCLLAAIFPVVLIVGVFFAIDWIIRRARPK